jgi:hypothetical protein
MFGNTDGVDVRRGGPGSSLTTTAATRTAASRALSALACGRDTLAFVRALVPLSVLVAIGVVSLAACAIYDTSLLLPAEAVDAGADSGGSDASTIDGAVDASLPHAFPPPPPTSDDGTENLDILFAMNAMRVLPNGTSTTAHPAAPVGFDLDGVRTCPGPESCTPVAGQMHCDGDGGTDNAGGLLFQTFASLGSQFNDDSVTQRLRTGRYDLLFRMKSYNGGRNDRQVIMIIYLSSEIESIPDGGLTPMPVFDGTDVWTVDPSSLVGGLTVDGGPSCEGNDNACIPLFVDPAAYVTDGVVVAHVDFPISLGSASNAFVVDLSDGLIVATLVRDGGAARIDEGQLAGRWNTTQLLTAFQAVSDPVNGTQYLCGTNGTYQNIKKLVCRGVDIATNPLDDGMGKPCDALSVAVSFSASPAHLGQILYHPPVPPPCGDNWKDDCSGVK